MPPRTTSADPDESPTMLVVACSAQRGVRLERRARPHPRPGELLLRLRCAGLCGTDLFKLQHGTVPDGTVLGHELVGTVEEAGDGTSRFSAGERIVVPHHLACGHCPLCLRGSETLCPVFRENLFDPGGFSELVVLRERAVETAARPVPPDLADEAAVFLEPAACVLRGIHRAALPFEPAGDRLRITAAILGAGSMGLLHLLVLKALHPPISVLVADPLADRRALAAELGADAVAGPDELTGAMDELSAGLGADAVFDTAGGAGRARLALDLTREGGTVVLFAHSAPGEPAGFELNRLFKHERRLVGTYSSSLQEQSRIFELLTTGRLDPRPLVTHRLPLSRFAQAVRLSAERRALKILLVPE